MHIWTRDGPLKTTRTFYLIVLLWSRLGCYRLVLLRKLSVFVGTVSPVAHVGFSFKVILLPQELKSWKYSHEPPYLSYLMNSFALSLSEIEDLRKSQNPAQVCVNLKAPWPGHNSAG